MRRPPQGTRRELFCEGVSTHLSSGGEDNAAEWRIEQHKLAHTFNFYTGRPVVPPGTNGQSKTSPAGGSSGPEKRFTASRSAAAPIASKGTDTLVIAGPSSGALPGASKPV